MIQYRMHFKTEQSHFFNTKNELLDIINKLTLNFWLSAKELHLSKSVKCDCSEKAVLLEIERSDSCGHRRK